MLRLPARARVFGVSSALAVASLAFTPFVPASASSPPPPPPTWGVTAGNFDFSPAQEATAFYPARIVVHAGDDVVFTPNGGHTVTFNPIRVDDVPNFAYADPTFPAGPHDNTLTFANRPGKAIFNSGDLSAAGSYTLHIDQGAAGSGGEDRLKASSAGNDDGNRGTTYQYFCQFHRGMTGLITVLPAGSQLPSTNDQNQTRAALAMKADIKRGQRALRQASQNVEDNRVAAGVGATSIQGLGTTSVARFGPGSIHIKVGESVTWVNPDLNTPHTVTFGTETAPPNPNPFGLPPGFLPDSNRTLSAPGQTANSGVLWSQQLIDYLNFGALVAAAGIPAITDRVTITFTAPGNYPYFCAFHDSIGMVGTVFVSNDN